MCTMWTMAETVWQVKPGKDGTYSKTIRFSPDEVMRLNAVLAQIQARPAARGATFNKAMKELLGVAHYGLVTDLDRHMLTSVPFARANQDEQPDERKESPVGVPESSDALPGRGGAQR
jgi:hypothetical protein